MSHATHLPPRDALAAIAWCTMCADGHVEGEEDEAIVEGLARLPEFAGEGERVVRDALVRAHAQMRKRGEDALLSLACASLPPDRRAAAWRLARDIAAADGEPDESPYLERLRRLLGVEAPQA